MLEDIREARWGEDDVCYSEEGCVFALLVILFFYLASKYDITYKNKNITDTLIGWGIFLVLVILFAVYCSFRQPIFIFCVCYISFVFGYGQGYEKSEGKK